YRESYGIFACNGILFNHESPRRGGTLVTRKITRGVAQIKPGLADKLHLGKLDANGDWGYTKEDVMAMWLVRRHEARDDAGSCTGETYSVRECIQEAFSYAGLDWRKHVEIDSKYYRPAEVDLLVGDASKAKSKLGWAPRTRFKDLVRLMVDADVATLGNERKLGSVSQ